MKRKLLIILLFLISIELSYANAIGVNNKYVWIEQWEETNVIEGRDLHVSLVVDLKFNKVEILKTGDSFLFKFLPREDVDSGQLPIKNVEFTVCHGGSHSHSYYNIPINCSKVVPFENSSKIRVPGSDYVNYYLEISLNDINFNDAPLFIGISYTISNFVEKSFERSMVIDTVCSATHCPPPTLIEKFFMLPKESAVTYFPPDSILTKKDDRLVILLNDFTPYLPSHGKYERKVIMYTDLKQEKLEEGSIRKKWFYYGILATFLITIFISLLKWILYDRRREAKIKITLGNIIDKLKELRSDTDSLKKVYKKKRKSRKK